MAWDATDGTYDPKGREVYTMSEMQFDQHCVARKSKKFVCLLGLT